MNAILKKSGQIACTAALISALFACHIQNKETSKSTEAATPGTSTAPLVTGLPDFSPLVSKISPAVVNIRTSEMAQPRGSSGNSDPICQIWPDFPLCLNQKNRSQPESAPRERLRGVGSGFLISADGYILTNHHVIDGASSIVVSMSDKKEYKAKVVGSDERSDVAVLKIEGANLPFLAAANSDNIKVGQWVMAAGSPFGLENTVTAGIVSAIKRDTGEYESFIQTDAAVNPGNSGGPLVNMSGEVVGINSQILSNSGAFAGIALAIPINEALKVADQIRSSGKVSRGRIGVAIGNIDEDIAKALGLPRASGSLVKTVEEGSAAANAGLQAGDVILKVDSRDIESSADFARMIGNSAPGTHYALLVWRQGKSVNLDVTVGAETDSKQAKPKTESKTAPSNEGIRAERLGLSVAALSTAELKQAHVTSGVKITQVSGAAESAGLEVGDIILQVNNEAVSSPDDFNRMVQTSKDKVLLLVQRGDATQYLVIKP